MSKKTQELTGEDIEGLAVEEETSAPITKKYDEQMRMLVTQKLDIPLRSLLPMIESNQLNLRPDFQRRDRWDETKQSRFVESVVMNVPVPPVFLGEDEYGSYVVLDGRQRLTAISTFIQNRFQLSDLEVWPELNGKRFHEIGEVQNFIMRRFIPAIVILKESSSEIKYDVFDRLNTGGVVAVPMEIRNAIFRGDFTNSIKALSEYKTFRELWGIPLESPDLETNKLFAKMEDVEIVLRFFTIQDYKSFAGRLKDHLSHFMKERNALYENEPAQLAKDEQLFKLAVSNAKKIFGIDAFRKPSTGRTSARSAPLADAILFGCSKVDMARFTAEKIQAAQKGLQDLFASNTAFVDSVSKGTNGKGAITIRVEAVSQMLLAIQDAP